MQRMRETLPSPVSVGDEKLRDGGFDPRERCREIEIFPKGDKVLRELHKPRSRMSVFANTPGF